MIGERCVEIWKPQPSREITARLDRLIANLDHVVKPEVTVEMPAPKLRPVATIYVRVPTFDQEPDNQLRERRYVEAPG